MTEQALTPAPARALTPDRNPATVYLASLGSEQSRRTMRQALADIAQLVTGQDQADPLAVNWAALEFQHTAAIRAALIGKHSAATANKILCALRGVLKAAHRLGLMGADQYSQAVDIEAVKGETLPAGRALTAGEIGALLEACTQDATPAGARDGALIALLRAGGLRRAELCALDLADYDPAACTLRVKGKRNKERETPLAPGAIEALTDWLDVRGRQPGPLFYPITKSGEIERTDPEKKDDKGKPLPRRMTPQAIYKTLAKRAEQANVKNLSPHDFRRTFASDLLDAGADIATVAKLGGWANVQTAARYDRRGEAAKRKAVNLLHIPYKKRGASYG